MSADSQTGLNLMIRSQMQKIPTEKRDVLKLYGLHWWENVKIPGNSLYFFSKWSEFNKFVSDKDLLTIFLYIPDARSLARAGTAATECS